MAHQRGADRVGHCADAHLQAGAIIHHGGDDRADRFVGRVAGEGRDLAERDMMFDQGGHVRHMDQAIAMALRATASA